MKAETRVGIFIVIAIGIFIYLSVNIGAFRLDKANYDIYKTYFDDTGGLDVKSPIKIAGVDVGWVEAINLLEDGKAEVVMRVSKNIKLAKNSYAMISQEGLIGTKNLVLEPGDPSVGYLLPGSILAMPGKTPATVGELMDQFKDIATSIQDLASSFKNVFATQKGEDQMKTALDGLARAANKMADFSTVLDRVLQKNEENINYMITDFRSVAKNLESGVPRFNNNFDKITLALADDALPKISSASQKVGSAFETIDDTAVQAKEAFREAEQVAEKINTGKGLVGKLINEDETYDDLKKSIRGLKDYLTKAQSMAVDVDMHSETLLTNDWNSKGYFDLRIRPSQDYFYKLQLISDERGSIIREESHTEYYDPDSHRIKADKYFTPENYGDSEYGKAQLAHDKLDFTRQKDKLIRRRNDILFGFQFGKKFDRVALRMGLFENTFGFGLDYYVPLHTDKFHWITTLEAFDFKGTKRMKKWNSPLLGLDDRPYIKWMNKVFFMKHIYTVFGMDDMISKHNCGPFFGGGIRFGDDDLKYLLSSLPVGSLAGGK